MVRVVTVCVFVYIINISGLAAWKMLFLYGQQTYDTHQHTALLLSQWLPAHSPQLRELIQACIYPQSATPVPLSKRVPSWCQEVLLTSTEHCWQQRVLHERGHV
jgi:hypothetical protein